VTDLAVSNLTAVLAHLAPTIAALAALFQGLRNGKKAEVITMKAETIVEKTGEVHALVNSNLAAVKADLAVANERIKELSALVVKLTEAQESR